MSHAIAVEDSDNAKTGLVSVTHVAQDSCPADCPLRGAGCYAEYGSERFVAWRLKARGRIPGPGEIAREEARAIDRLSGDRPLRLHVVGDCRTNGAARVVGEAAARYRRRGGRPVWTYTHAWRRVARASWGDAVSVLASCERPEDAAEAMRQEYAAALVVERFQCDAAYQCGPVKVLPCPNQTRGVQCRDCRLCWDDTRLRDAGLVIGFEAHGPGRRRALATLATVS
jgi:hypothetical protein